ncbi:MAG: hypothetical protein AAGB12_10075 [Pseudomonadota bacterium]
MIVDLSDDTIKNIFALYILEEMRNIGLDVSRMTSIVNLGEKQLKRYLPGNAYDPPKKISDDMYFRLLTAVKKSNDDFKSHLEHATQSNHTPPATQITKTYHDHSVDMSGSTFKGDIHFKR